MQHSMQAIAMREKFALTPSDLGMVQSAAGLVSIASNTLVVGWLVKMASSENQVMCYVAVIIHYVYVVFRWIVSN
jgi:hypothetical protein